MKFVPRDLPPKPERPASPSASTTRYLRLTPARDVPVIPSEPVTTPAVSDADADATAPEEPQPSPATDPEPAPGTPSAGFVRPISKRLPNVFMAAPSARWTPPPAGSVTSSQLLRRIPVSEIAGATSSSIANIPVIRPPEPTVAAPEEPVQPAEAIEQLDAEPSPTTEFEAESALVPEIEPTEELVNSEPAIFAGPTLVAPVSLRPQPLARLGGATSLARLTGNQRTSLGRGFWILLAILIIVLVLLIYFFGLTPRIAASQDLDNEQKFISQRVIVYSVARLATPKVELPLPGTVEAFQQASLYARTNGSVKKWLVDIGDVVKEGQLLAELDTPEVDQQLAQAKAAADQTQANLAITQSAADRWDTMAKAHAVAQEDADQKDAANNEARASNTAAQANLARLTDLEKLKEIRAPFPGKITYRNIEIGSLVSAGPGAPNSELFRVSQTDPLRIFIDVPESDVPSIKAGVPARIEVTSYPGRDFEGKVVRDAGALSETSRTLRTEVQVDNPNGALLPGAFAEVRLQLFDSGPAVLIPASTLIVSGTGTSVALVISDGGHDVVRYTPVRVGRDFGTEVEILNNVRAGDRLVTNPPADLNDGTVVTAKPLEQPAPPVPISRNPPAPKA